MLSEREKLIYKLKNLIEINDAKQKAFQLKQGNFEIGCLTKEALLMAKMYPQMIALGVSFDDCKKVDEIKREKI